MMIADKREEEETRDRKDYTITKSRESWTDKDHELFVEAIKLYERDWKKIAKHINVNNDSDDRKEKTIIQIRSHAQKYFLKIEKLGNTSGVVIPPPRPKKKAQKPYPQKKKTTDTNKTTNKNNLEAQLSDTAIIEKFEAKEEEQRKQRQRQAMMTMMTPPPTTTNTMMMMPPMQMTNNNNNNNNFTPAGMSFMKEPTDFLNLSGGGAFMNYMMGDDDDTNSALNILGNNSKATKSTSGDEYLMDRLLVDAATTSYDESNQQQQMAQSPRKRKNASSSPSQLVVGGFVTNGVENSTWNPMQNNSLTEAKKKIDNQNTPNFQVVYAAIAKCFEDGMTAEESSMNLQRMRPIDRETAMLLIDNLKKNLLSKRQWEYQMNLVGNGFQTFLNSPTDINATTTNATKQAFENLRESVLGGPMSENLMNYLVDEKAKSNSGEDGDDHAHTCSFENNSGSNGKKVSDNCGSGGTDQSQQTNAYTKQK